MSHSHEGAIPLPDDLGQSQTVFFSAVAGTAALVTNVNGIKESHPMDVEGPHSALEWCQHNRAHFVFVATPIVAS